MSLLRRNIIRLACVALALTRGVAAFADVTSTDLGAPVDGGAGDLALPPDPDAPTVGVSINATTAAIGDKLTLIIAATSKEGVLVSLPNALELGKFEVLSRDEGDKAGLDVGNGRRSRRFVLGIASYEIGTHAIPEIRLSYINPQGDVRSVDTEPLLVTITGLIAEGDNQETQPLRATHSTLIEDRRAISALKYGGIALGALIVLGVAQWLVRRVLRRRAEAAQVAPPPRPAHEVALERLAALRARGNFAEDSYRPFYFELAEILRAYLGGRFAFDSLELTTAELMTVLATKAPAVAAKDGPVDRFLQEADLIKFAKFGSDPEAVARAFAIVEDTIANTKEIAPPPVADAAAADTSPPATPKTPPPTTGGGDAA